MTPHFRCETDPWRIYGREHCASDSRTFVSVSLILRNSLLVLPVLLLLKVDSGQRLTCPRPRCPTMTRHTDTTSDTTLAMEQSGRNKTKLSQQHGQYLGSGFRSRLLPARGRKQRQQKKRL